MSIHNHNSTCNCKSMLNPLDSVDLRESIEIAAVECLNEVTPHSVQHIFVSEEHKD